jgi:hypothetical protein
MDAIIDNDAVGKRWLRHSTFCFTLPANGKQRIERGHLH